MCTGAHCNYSEVATPLPDTEPTMRLEGGPACELVLRHPSHHRDVEGIAVRANHQHGTLRNSAKKGGQLVVSGGREEKSVRRRRKEEE